MEQKELLTVIVADDETELREAVCSVIPWKEIGFRLVGSAGNGLDALQLVEQFRPMRGIEIHRCFLIAFGIGARRAKERND